MSTKLTNHLIFGALLFVASCSTVFAQNNLEVQSASSDISTMQSSTPQESNTANSPPAIIEEKNWYFSWGYSRQWYAPSDIHVTQPGLGNNFTVHQVKASDFATTVPDGISSTLNLNFSTRRRISELVSL